MSVFVSVDGRTLPGTIVESNVYGAFARPYQAPVDAIRLDTGELVYACMAPARPCLAQSAMNPAAGDAGVFGMTPLLEDSDNNLAAMNGSTEGVLDTTARVGDFEKILHTMEFSTEEIVWIKRAAGYRGASDDEYMTFENFDANTINRISMHLIRHLHDVPEEVYFTFFVKWAKFCADYTQTPRSSESDLGIFVNFMKTYNLASHTTSDKYAQEIFQLQREKIEFSRKASQFLNLPYKRTRSLMDFWRLIQTLLTQYKQETGH